MTERSSSGAARPSSARLWLPAVIWLGLIFAGSSVSLPGSTPNIFRFQDKLAHIVEFGVLGLLLVRAVYSQASDNRLRYWACIIGASLYGALDEFHQSIVPGRTVELADFAADTLGSFFFAWAWLRLKGKSLFRPAKTPEKPKKIEK